MSVKICRKIKELKTNIFKKTSIEIPYDVVIKDNDTEYYYKIISFKFNSECDANIEKYLSQGEINEIIGENLKKDFINFLKNK
jgi:hypothetical protein